MFIGDVKTDATANDRRQQRSRNESRDREGEKSSFHFVIVFKVKLNSRSRFSLPLRGAVEGRRSNERGRASLFAQLKNLNNVNFHPISRRAGGQRKKTDWQPNCIRTTCRLLTAANTSQRENGSSSN